MNPSNTDPMSDTTTPYVSDEQIKANMGKVVDYYVQNMYRINGHADFGLGAISGAEFVRDLYEARLSEVIKERDDARANLARAEGLLHSLKSASTSPQKKDRIARFLSSLTPNAPPSNNTTKP